MTDVKELCNVVESKGMTIASLARVIGMQKQTLYNRMDAPDFKVSEIEKICDALGLGIDERDAIFFKNKCD